MSFQTPDPVAANAVLRAERARIEELVGAGDTSASTLESLTRILALLPDKPLARNRWPVAAAFAVTGCLLSLLFFVRLSTTRIELSATVSELSFTTSATAAFAFPTPLRQLKAAPVAAEAAEPFKGVALDCLIGLSTFQVNLPPQPALNDSIGIDAIRLPKGTVVGLQPQLSDRRYDFILEPAKAQSLPELQVGLDGSWSNSSGSCANIAAAGGPEEIMLEPEQGPLAIALTIERSASEQLAIPVSSVELSTLEPAGLEGMQVSRSYLHSAQLRLPGIGDKAYRFEAGDFLGLSDLQGSIQSLSLKGGEVSFRYVGTAGTLRRGRDTNLMPTVFDWLISQHGFIALWGALIYAAGVLLAIEKWWSQDAG